MKLGISIKINVKEIEKARLFVGKKGTYLDLTTFIDTDNPGEHGDHGFISQSVSKEEREQNVRTPILGNCTVFYNDNHQPRPQAPQQAPRQQPQQAPADDAFDSDIPFS